MLIRTLWARYGFCSRVEIPLFVLLLGSPAILHSTRFRQDIIITSRSILGKVSRFAKKHEDLPNA